MFFFSRLLAFLPLGNFFRSTLGKIVIGFGVAVLISIALLGWLKLHDRSLIKQTTIAFNNKQLQQVIKDNNLAQIRLAHVSKNQKTNITQLQARIDANMANLLTYITTLNSIKYTDRVSSGVLKDAVKVLQK